MTSENLMLASVTGSVAIRNSFEFKRIATLMDRMNALPETHLLIADHPYLLSASAQSGKISAAAGGRFAGARNCRAVLRSAKTPDRDIVPLRIRLASDKTSRSARLTISFDPARMLTGAECHPTLENQETGTPIIWPSSSSIVVGELLQVGFNFLGSLHLFLSDASRPLFDPAVQLDGIRIDRIAW